jgi:hypothetical protein
MVSIRFAWRNMWRNKRRTVITLIALAANTAILIATFALMEGYVHNAISYVTDLILGERQRQGCTVTGFSQAGRNQRERCLQESIRTAKHRHSHSLAMSWKASF